MFDGHRYSTRDRERMALRRLYQDLKEGKALMKSAKDLRELAGFEQMSRAKATELLKRSLGDLLKESPLVDEEMAKKLCSSYDLKASFVLDTIPGSDEFFEDSAMIVLDIAMEVGEVNEEPNKALCIGGGYSLSKIANVLLKQNQRIRNGPNFSSFAKQWSTVVSATTPEDPARPEHSALFSAVSFQNALGIKHCKSPSLRPRKNPVEKERNNVALVVSSIGSSKGYCADLLKEELRKKTQQLHADFLFNVFSKDGKPIIYKKEPGKVYSVFDLDELRSRVRAGMMVCVVVTDYTPYWEGRSSASKRPAVTAKAEALKTVLSANANKQKDAFLTHLVIDIGLARSMLES